MRPDLSNVTEDDVKALFNEDGELMEPDSADEESTEEETEEEESDGEETEAEEQEASAEEEIDWNQVDERYRKAFEQTKSEAEKWQKDHGKIQSKWTKESQSRKEELKNLDEFRAKANELSRWEELLGQNPKLAQVVSQEIERMNGGYQEEVPDYLKNDPMFQHIQKSVAPTINALQQKIQHLEQKTQRLDQWESQQVEAKNRSYLDNQLSAAKEQVKSIFGTEATEDQITEVLEYMVENKFYSNGKAAALAVFGDQYEKAARSRYETEMKEKAKKFPARTKTVNSNRVGSSRDASTPEEAIAMALADQGL